MLSVWASRTSDRDYSLSPAFLLAPLAQRVSSLAPSLRNFTPAAFCCLSLTAHMIGVPIMVVVSTET